jgi:hypothetical protein
VSLDAEWLACMRRGDLNSAWQVSDRVLAARAGEPSHHLPRHEQWIWDGTPIEGRCVLIRCYHGLGDTIQFVRYAPMVRAVARRVVVWAQPALLPVLSTMRGAFDELLPLTDGSPPCDYEVDVEVMELPHVFRSTLETIPAQVPYLHVEPIALPRSQRPNVGLVWRSGEWDKRRSVPFELVRELAKAVDVRWHVLQRGPGLAEWDRSFGVDVGSDEPLAAARAMKGLDLVITIDSMPAHLAGALGVPVWTLLCHEADWRWIEGRSDSPWYPTMRLFRQERKGDWWDVLERVGRLLAKGSLPARPRRSRGAPSPA